MIGGGFVEKFERLGATGARRVEFAPISEEYSTQLAAAAEITDAGKRVLLLDQEGEQSLGGQAFWSFGGLFLVDSPEQRRLRVKDSFESPR